MKTKYWVMPAPLLCLLLLLFTACRKRAEDKVCESGIVILSSTVTGPTTGTVGIRMGFSVRVGLTNGCGVLRGMESGISGNTITLRPKGQYIGCACTDIYQQVDLPYAYDPTRPGTYTIEVVQPTGAAKMHTFTVQ